ncbi:helix-turn-helix domain-containing protein [Rhizobium sp.]|jgi:AraC family transcriptional regulator, transcriptional activator FtrA|uniref:helix-turn-helix domain-containing protein n=1 Tax=Rhizobium sp. TaxID=391 RepID=UPI000E8DAC4F|nr:transcriptional regulator FtrA [Rhizobium sp.]
MEDKHKIVILAYLGVNVFELGLIYEIFELSRALRDCYDVVVCSEHPGEKFKAGPISIVTEFGIEEVARANTVIVPGWIDVDATPPGNILEHLKRAHAGGKRIVSVCSGVFLLAAAGLLDGRRAAVHWSQARLLAERYPKIHVDAEVLYVDEGDVLSSAGRAAGMDLCLHIVRKDHGGKVARSVAQRMVIPAFRDGGQSQYIPQSAQTQIDSLAELRGWLVQNLDRKIDIDEMAARVCMSRRTFLRRFQAATDLTPGEWLIRERVGRARTLLEETVMPIEHIAESVGFASADALRHHFRKRFGVSAVSYRNHFRTEKAITMNPTANGS